MWKLVVTANNVSNTVDGYKKAAGNNPIREIETTRSALQRLA